MPLYFCLPLIIWLGMCAVAQDEMRALAETEAKR